MAALNLDSVSTRPLSVKCLVFSVQTNGSLESCFSVHQAIASQVSGISVQANDSLVSGVSVKAIVSQLVSGIVCQASPCPGSCQSNVCVWCQFS